MIVIKTGLVHIPDSCDSCQWYESRPHPYKGWTDICELMGHSLDADQPEEWIYGGDDRPEACPLIEVNDGDPRWRFEIK